MKKFISIVLIGAVLLSFSGCAFINRLTAENREGKYKDGIYDGTGDEWEFGNENATVTIEKGKIVSIVLRRLDKEGQEVNYDYFNGETREGRLYPDLRQYRIDMAEEMVDKQSYEVDLISGATISARNWKLAVQRALNTAVK